MRSTCGSYVCGRVVAGGGQVLDLGSNIGSFALYALERGCHVIAFDMLAENILRLLQTVARAETPDGRLFLERFHGFRNGLR
jgi:cyclopropane fatty-acyl-phospholipid synthase-like methyltransferase